MKNFVFETKLLYVVLFFLFLFSSVRSNAQIDTFPTPIIKGNRFMPDKKGKSLQPIGLDKSGGSYVVVFKGIKENAFLSHFDSAMNEINSVELKLENNGKALYLQAVLLVKDELFIVSSLRDESSQKIITYVQTANKNTLLPDNNIRELCSIDFPKSMNGCYRATGYLSTPYLIKVILSRDESKIMICNTSFCQFNNTLSVFVFDDTFNVLWSKVINAEIKDVKEIDFDNNGNVFFMMQSLDPKRLLESGIPRNYCAFYLIGFFDKGTEVKEFPFFLKEKIITNMALSVDNHNNIMCAGFYTKAEPFKGTGTYFFKIEQNLKTVSKVTVNDFDINLYLTKCSAEELQKAKEGKSFPNFNSFKVQLYCNEEGSMVLTGEAHSYLNETSYAKQIVSFKYSNNGDLIWSNKIPKLQYAGKYSSYFATFVGEDFYIIYNDNASNFNVKPCEDPEIFSFRTESMMVVVKLNAQGKIVKKYMLPNIKPDVYMLPTATKIFNKDQLILLGESFSDESYKCFKTTLRY